MLRHTAYACLLLVGALAARPSFADLAGPAMVIDGDTLVVAGELVRILADAVAGLRPGSRLVFGPKPLPLSIGGLNDVRHPGVG